MDKFILVLFLLAVLSVCTIAKPIDAIKSRGASVLRAVALYANPFGWIGTPGIIRRATNRVKKSEQRNPYRWYVEIDESNHWWVTVYDNSAKAPGPGRKTMMKLF